MLKPGENIRKIRILRGYNQEQLAEMASLNRVTIAKYESGKVEPGAQALSRIADALEVTVDQLLGRDDATQKEPDESRLNKELMDRLDRLTPENRIRADAYLEGLLASQEA